MTRARLTAVPGPGPRRLREHERAALTVRLYDTARLSIANGLAPGEVVARLGEELRCAVWVCPNDSRLSAFPPHDAPPPALARQLGEAIEVDGRLGGLRRLETADGVALAVNVEVRRATSLIAVPRGGTTPSFALLQHAATLAALQLERLWSRSADVRRRGGETLERLLDGAAAAVEPWGIADDELVVVALAEGEWEGIDWIHDALGERGIASLVASRGQVVYALLPGTELVLEQLPAIFAGASIGVSRRFDDARIVATGASQARAALEAGIVRFEDLRPSFLPRSTAEAHATVDRVLGSIIRYDEAHGTELVRSLATFLQCDRSWQRTAEALGVHKQTLVYRMRRIDELTGRRLRRTEVLAESWLALKAHGVLDG